MRYLVTGGSGFIGRHVVARLLRRPDAEVHVLVRPASVGRLERLAASWGGPGRLLPTVGDIGEQHCGLDAAALGRLAGVDHVVHLAALYDMTASAEAAGRANVEGTARVVGLAEQLNAGCLHHVSSVAVAGDYRGEFTEQMFDAGQRLPSPYHETKFRAEQTVREHCAVPWRVYRPAVVVGHSVSGEMDKVDGPYYFFPTFQRLAALPSFLPLVLPQLGATNIVPVDFVAEALDALLHKPGLDGRAFHLVHHRPQPFTEVYNAFARAAGAPQVRLALSQLTGPTAALGGALGRLLEQLPAGTAATRMVYDYLGIPAQVVPHLSFPSRFTSADTVAASGLTSPELAGYAPALWRYWQRHLDPDRARRGHPRRPLEGRTIVITGASSGIGKATALQVAARGATPLLLARSTERLTEVVEQIRRDGGRAQAYPCNLVDEESVAACIKQILADHDAVDMLVNNAGRSIRRSVKLSQQRFHDYERTMALNYFGALRMIFALLPHMTERRFGHIVNVSSVGVQASPPRFSAYVASKAALDAFSKVVASETIGDGVTFTTVHMPLVRTPMIAPTTIYAAFPTIAPEEAAGLVVRALERRPKRITTPVGNIAEVTYALAPGVVDTVLHAAYLVFPDSTAAAGDGAVTGDLDERLSAAALTMARLLPGVHW